jgi:hypothetical protein
MAQLGGGCELPGARLLPAPAAGLGGIVVQSESILPLRFASAQHTYRSSQSDARCVMS